MNERMQKALDGDLAREDLTPPEQAELLEAEAVIGAVLRAVPTQSIPDLAPAVLRSIRERTAAGGASAGAAPRPARVPRRWHLTDWLWQPRSISMSWRPAYAVAAVIVLAVVVVAESLRPDRAAIDRTPLVFTQFLLRAPDASEVALAGDFSNWQPAYQMTRSEPGVWTVVVPLEPGIHSYSFVVDGERWVPDPMAPAFDDGFGGKNSRLAVLTPDAGRR